MGKELRKFRFQPALASKDIEIKVQAQLVIWILFLFTVNAYTPLTNTLNTIRKLSNRIETNQSNRFESDSFEPRQLRIVSNRIDLQVTSNRFESNGARVGGKLNRIESNRLWPQPARSPPGGVPGPGASPPRPSELSVCSQGYLSCFSFWVPTGRISSGRSVFFIGFYKDICIVLARLAG